MALPYRSIACCIDDTPAAEEALAHARSLAEVHSAALSLVHVGPYPLLVEEVEGQMVVRREDLNAAAREWITRRAAGVPGAEAVFLEGFPGPAVVEWAAGAGVDLLVTAAHHGRLEGLLLGSFAHHLVNQSPCPVLIVRPHPTAR
jgi:nucleotide-binding universal stress UspA family protein